MQKFVDGISTALTVLMSCMAVALCSGCASNPYQYGTGRMDIDLANSPPMQHQFYLGRPNAFLDASGWIWPGSLLSKLLLWDKNIDSHRIDQTTVDDLRTYLHANNLRNVQVLVNAYEPGNQWSRLFKNHTVGAGWRYTLGVLSVTRYTVLPGRFFGGDAYNPYTNTIYLYSNEPSVALHEGGHAKDFGRRNLKGTNAALYSLPFAALYYEARATNDALGYLRCQRDTKAQKDADKLLYPAYATYIGGSVGQVIAAPVLYLAVIPGHIAGHIAAANVKPASTEPAKPGAAPDSTPRVDGCGAPLFSASQAPPAPVSSP